MSGGLVERLRGINRNYDLARGIHCDIREAADRIEALEAAIVQAREALALAHEELRLWRSLVDEGGVPRYTITPGAALNTVVTSTDAVLRRLSALDKQ